MTDQQNQIISTIEQIAEMIKAGKMPLELCPVADLKTVLNSALCYGEQSLLEKEIAEQLCSVLNEELSRGGRA